MRCFQALVAFVTLVNGSTAWATDYSKVDRTIKAEPVYQSKSPKYALLVFGREAKFRVWAVSDGDAIYLDRNGDGDLTGQGEWFAKTDDCKNIEIADPDGKTRYVVRNLEVYVEDKSTPGQLMVNVDITGPLIYKQYSDAALQVSPAKAPISHFHGPLAMGPVTFSWKVSPNLAFKTGEKPLDFRSMIGTMDAENGCWVVVRSDKDGSGKVAAFPKDVFPNVDVEFPSKTPGGPTVKKRYPLDGFC